MEAEVQLPIDIRDDLVDELDEVLDAYPTEPPPSVVVGHLIEQFEILAEEEGYEGVSDLLENESDLDASLVEVLEHEVAELVDFDGEELVALLEQIAALEWSEDEDEDDEGWGDDDWHDDGEWSEADDLFDDLDAEDDDV